MNTHFLRKLALSAIIVGAAAGSAFAAGPDEHHLTAPENMHRMVESMDKMDKNGTQVITKKAFLAKMAQIFDSTDKAKAGYLSTQQVEQMMMKMDAR